MDNSEKFGALSSLMASYGDEDDDSEDEVVAEDQGRKQYNTLENHLENNQELPVKNLHTISFIRDSMMCPKQIPQINLS